MPPIHTWEMVDLPSQAASLVSRTLSYADQPHAEPGTLPATVPELGRVAGTLLNMSSLGILSILLSRRLSRMIYFFLVEKAHVVRSHQKPRLQDRLWCFNFFGMIIPFLAVIALNFILRIAFINYEGTCIIGQKRIGLIMMLVFDVGVNVYLNILFLTPMAKIYIYQNTINPTLRRVAIRTFIGNCATLISSVVNIIWSIVLNGEPGWQVKLTALVGLTVLFTTAVLHWVTTIDNITGSRNISYNSENFQSPPLQTPQAARSRMGSVEGPVNTDRSLTFISTWAGLEAQKDHPPAWPKDVHIPEVTTIITSNPLKSANEQTSQICDFDRGIHITTVKTQKVQKLEETLSLNEVKDGESSTHASIHRTIETKEDNIP
ncbi:MAG: hypothetical protein M1834_002016 [Cirrosporium novae-zelandiae]|nr:MAG: hypothetical protein M1834_002016 [Cirrosporium novae-zelandiae]